MSKKSTSSFIAFLICMVMITSTFVGCGKSPAAGVAEQDKKIDINKFTPVDGKQYTIEWLGTLLNAPVPDDAQMKVYLEKKYNVKFKMDYIDRSKWDELLNVKLASGDVPDIIAVADPNVLKNYVDQDLIAEVPIELLQKFAPKITANIDETAKANAKANSIDPWTVSKIDGKNYGIPLLNGNGYYHFTSIWREDWLKNVGITKIPETLQEYEDAFYKFVNNDPDQNGKNDTYALSNGYKDGPFASIYGAFGYLPYFWSLKDGKMVYGAVQPEMKDALTYLAKWYKDKLISPEFITGENKGGHWSISTDFVSGVIGYSNNGPFYTNAPGPIGGPKGGKMYRAFTEAHKKDGAKMVVGRPAIGPNGKSGSIVWGNVAGNSIVFSKKLLDEPDKMGKILSMVEDMCTNYDNYKLLQYGVEGQNYKFDDSGSFVDLTPEGTVGENLGISGSFQAWYGNMGFEKQWDPKYYEYADKNATYSKDYTNMLLTKLPSQDKYWDEIDKLQKDTYIKIIMGEKPVSYFDEFVKQWREKGGDQLEKEATEWYNSVK